jgi:protein involved in polysaccharide export with SLBB domain
MREVIIRFLLRSAVVASLGCLGVGCASVGTPPAANPEPANLPRELNKMNLPDYIIEPPDVLLINATRLVPLPPYHITPLDTLMVQAKFPLPTEPLSGEFVVEPEGRVNLGSSYGSVQVAGLTVDQAHDAIEKQLKGILANPSVYVAIGRTKPLQQIVGQHLVRPDGQVSLGTYGMVRVCGLTAMQAKQAIETHLRQFLQEPEVSVDVMAFNSKVIYVIFDGGGYGQQVYRLPAMGNETVLDAIGEVYGLSSVSSTHHIWVARPAPGSCGQPQVLPVDWKAVTTEGVSDTNYQLFPGDRVYVKANVLVTVDTFLARVISPVQRLAGSALLVSGLIKDLSLYPARAFAFGAGGGTR